MLYVNDFQIAPHKNSIEKPEIVKYRTGLLKGCAAGMALVCVFFVFEEVLFAESNPDGLQSEQAAAPSTPVPANSLGNLFRNSRFPLGLQSGWSVGGDGSIGDDLAIDADANTVGPSRAPALRIQAKETVSVWTEPFRIVEPTVPHHVVLSAKGTGTWKFSVSNTRDQSTPKETTVQLSGDWQKVEIPFQPDAGKAVASMKVEGQGTLWLDGLVACPAGQSDNDSKLSRCEVALALPKGPSAFERIQFEDVAPTIEYAVSGDHSAGDELHAKVFDLYGNSRELPVVRLGADFLQHGRLKYCETSLGCFRVEAWVERAGAKIGPVNEIVVSRLHKPRSWKKDAPDSFLGTHLVPSNQAIMQAKAIGINWVRCHGPALDLTGWAFIEPTQGKWAFPDAKVKRLRDHQLTILGQFGSAPAWASYRSDVKTTESLGYSDNWFQPKKTEEWSAYVRSVADHYKGMIQYYDVWSDPFHPQTFAVGWRQPQEHAFFSPFITSPVPQKDYAGLLKSAADTAKKVESSIQIVGMNAPAQIKGFKGQISAVDWVRGVIDCGGWNSLDVVAYRDSPIVGSGLIETAVQADSKSILLPIRQRFPNSIKPVWITYAATTRINSRFGFYNVTVPFQNQEESLKMADETCRYIIAALETDVQKIFLDESKPTSAPFLQGRTNIRRSLTTEDGYLNPSAAAVSNLAWQLDPLRFEKKMNPMQGVDASVFKNPKTSTAVLLKQQGADVHYRLPVRWGVTCTDMLGNPVARDSELRNQLVYVTVPSWLISIEAVIQGRVWIFNHWLLVALLSVAGIIAAAFAMQRRLAMKNRAGK